MSILNTCDARPLGRKGGDLRAFYSQSTDGHIQHKYLYIYFFWIKIGMRLTTIMSDESNDEGTQIVLG